jgi:hypothetical protein
MRQGSRVILSMAMADARGNSVRAVKTSATGRPSPPQVDILDGQGNVVYQCTLKYG